MPQQLKPIIHGRDHYPDGADPIFPRPGGDTIDQAILATVPSGFWKLNETSGSIAQDSSGNNLDLSTTSPELDPLWGSPAGPPGEQAADFGTGTGGTSGTASRVSRAPWPYDLAGDSFTAGLWANRTGTDATTLMGQEAPGRGFDGWQLSIAAHVSGDPHRPLASMAGMSGSLIVALNPLLAGTWAFLAMVYDHTSTTCKLYVNGLLNATSAPFAYDTTSGGEIWIGHDGGPTGSSVVPASFIGSYAFFVPRALTGAELLDINNADIGGDTSGLVLGLDDDGNTGWVYPTVKVNY